MRNERAQNRNFHRFLVLVVLSALVTGTDLAEAQLPFEWSYFPLDLPPESRTAPPLPSHPVQLILDDESSEGSFGVGSATSEQFLWFNRFDRPSFLNIDLREIWVLFLPGPNMAVGDEVELVVYLDPDSNPANGAELLATIDETIQVLDGTTFSVYSIEPPIPIIAPGDILIGVVNRFVESGSTGPTTPAALDTSSSHGRSWIAIWERDPPPDPILPPDLFIETIDGFVPGNWMIRGFGSHRSVVEVPALSWLGIGVLALLLGALGILLLQRRRVGGLRHS